MEAMDTMNGGTDIYATSHPLKIPKARPISTLMIMEATNGT